jgi:uncharacterized ferritin-like protein (DUF455 family)
MELREFAERVLFATSLEDKLRAPGRITDDHPGEPRSSPIVPGRPARLQFKHSDSVGGQSFPKQLERAKDRGRLLHFFANHELLATELMALAILRFPEAPASFRLGLLQTLKDEQEHTRLYIERMQACGIEFGELPVSGYFWRAISGMENPIDYVAGLSLTFEQANLDFARHFSREFNRVGDADGSRLLERIYKDEIAHVAYGLKWFRRWKNPEASDWEAFCRQLKYPLSPQRAKGVSFNIEGRRAAGLDSSFIAELDVYSQSKGRTPSIFVFNPLAEGYIARGRAFAPVKHQAQLIRDLANLPQFLCRRDDIVLVPNRPSVEFLSGLKQAGFSLPEFVECGDTPTRAMRELAERKLGGLRPWAWGPDSIELLAPLQHSVAGQARPLVKCFNPEIAELYSKEWSSGFLREFLQTVEPAPWLCTRMEVGTVARHIDAALENIESIRRRGHHRVVVKEALGLAGSNAIRLWEPMVLDHQLAWMKNVLAQKIPLVIEPWLERQFDFSLQLERTGRGLRLLGYTTLLNDAKGQYLGNFAASNHRQQVPAAITGLIREPGPVIGQLHELFSALLDSLDAKLGEVDFQGPLGIDAFVYLDSEGRSRLKPVVEINPRYTMGRLTVELMRQVCPGSHGILQLFTKRMVQSEGYEGLADYADSFRARFPLVLNGEPVHRIREGALCLNDPLEASACLAMFRVMAGSGGARPAGPAPSASSGRKQLNAPKGE